MATVTTFPQSKPNHPLPTCLKTPQPSYLVGKIMKVVPELSYYFYEAK